MRGILNILALWMLALFAGIWIWIGWKLWHFNPTMEKPKLDLSDAVVSVAGFLASSVGAGTASVLGIEIQKVQDGGDKTFGSKISAAAQSNFLLLLGIVVYAAVGPFNLLAWLGHSSAAPELIGAFGVGVLGWLGGAFTAVFRKT